MLVGQGRTNRCVERERAKKEKKTPRALGHVSYERAGLFAFRSPIHVAQEITVPRAMAYRTTQRIRHCRRELFLSRDQWNSSQDIWNFSLAAVSARSPVRHVYTGSSSDCCVFCSTHTRRRRSRR